jgi:molybdopterin biosynthesis enzyme
MTMAHDSSTQRIFRLTPLAAILAAIDARVQAVMAETHTLEAAVKTTLAHDVRTETLPRQPIALRDGYAVEASATADASSYVPISFPSPPRRVDVGEALPPDTDTVAPLDAIVFRGDRAEAVAAVTPGEGVLPAGGDIGDASLFRATRRLNARDVAVLKAAGVKEVNVRMPRLHVVRGGSSPSTMFDAAISLLAELIGKAGGIVSGKTLSFTDTLADETADAIITLGGTGSGRCDAAVLTLAQYGHIVAHGIAMSPGETSAFGMIGKRPVLLVPGRLDAVFAVWLLIGRPLVARLAGGTVDDLPVFMALKRKVTSTIGLVELIPVKITNGETAEPLAEPLGSGYLSLSMLAESDGYVVVPADSEGCAAGTRIGVRSWP